MSALAHLPDVLLISEVAEVMRRRPKGILNSLAAGTFLPLPFAERPYRWRKADIDAWYRGEFREAEARLRATARKRTEAA